MDLLHYKNFITIVEEGSLSAAAKKIHIAQPALSKQLKAFEKKYGTRLLELRRGGRTVELTATGRILYEKAKYLRDLEETVQKEIDECKSGVAGTLRIGISPSSSDSFIRNRLIKFHKRYPKVHFDLFEIPIDYLLPSLMHGDTEVLFIRAPVPQPERFHILFPQKERLSAIYRKDNPWIRTEHEFLRIADLGNAPLSLVKGWAEFFYAACADALYTPNILSLNSAQSAISWAKYGAAVAINPTTPAETFDDGLCRKFIDPVISSSSAFITVKGRSLSAIAQNFLDFCGS
ncbi:MAG: cynR 2 [Firmicutes bacterium]|nr:cynR 2 [Bacillota bacterium]